MERRRCNPSSRPSSLNAARHPGAVAFQLSPASRPRPHPPSPDERQRKKVRFANVAGSHELRGRQEAPICQADKTHRHVHDTRTSEYRYFKKLLEDTGHKFRSCKDSDQSIALKFSKGEESDNTVAHNHFGVKFPIRKKTQHVDEIPVTPAKLEEICDEPLNMQPAPCEFGNRDVSQIGSGRCLQTINLVRPIAQSSFEVAEISRNSDTEPGSGGIFSEKRSKLLKLAAHTASLQTDELLQRRSDFIGDALQRLGFRNRMSVHQKDSVTQLTTGRRHNLLYSPDSKGNSKKMLSNGTVESFTAMETLSNKSARHRGNGLCEFLALPWAYDLALPGSPDMGSKFTRNQESSLLLEDVRFSEQCTRCKSSSATELSLTVHSGEFDHLEHKNMFTLAVPGSIPNEFSPCWIEQQSIVPYTKSSPFWQPNLRSPLEQCISLSMGVDEIDPEDAEPSSTFELQAWVDQSPVKCAASSFSDLKYGVLDRHCPASLSSCHLNDYGLVSSDADHSEGHYELVWKNLLHPDLELWQSVCYLQPHGDNSRALLNFALNEDICNDFADQSTLMVVQRNPERSMFDLSDLGLFGSRYTLDSTGNPCTRFPDGLRW